VPRDEPAQALIGIKPNRVLAPVTAWGSAAKRRRQCTPPMRKLAQLQAEALPRCSGSRMIGGG